MHRSPRRLTPFQSEKILLSALFPSKVPIHPSCPLWKKIAEPLLGNGCRFPSLSNPFVFPSIIYRNKKNAFIPKRSLFFICHPIHHLFGRSNGLTLSFSFLIENCSHPFSPVVKEVKDPSEYVRRRSSDLKVRDVVELVFCLSMVRDSVAFSENPFKRNQNHVKKKQKTHHESLVSLLFGGARYLAPDIRQRH